MIHVNIKGVLYAIAAALPVFQQQGSGHLIKLVSTAGLKILPTMGVYAATKNAVRTITEALRQESVPSLRVTEVSPGMVATDFSASMTDPDVQAAMRQRIAEVAIPPEAIARSIAFAIEQPPEVDVGCFFLPWIKRGANMLVLRWAAFVLGV
jgi:NADP-dependent 3-hydroxy acid dehydrogenase YdfG